MDTSNKTLLTVVFLVIVALFLFFSFSMMSGTTWNGGMMRGWVGGSGMMGGISWMWLPTLFTLGLGIVIGWTIWGKKQ